MFRNVKRGSEALPASAQSQNKSILVFFFSLSPSTFFDNIHTKTTKSYKVDLQVHRFLSFTKLFTQSVLLSSSAFFDSVCATLSFTRLTYKYTDSAQLYKAFTSSFIEMSRFQQSNTVAGGGGRGGGEPRMPWCVKCQNFHAPPCLDPCE